MPHRRALALQVLAFLCRTIQRGCFQAACKASHAKTSELTGRDSKTLGVPDTTQTPRSQLAANAHPRLALSQMAQIVEKVVELRLLSWGKTQRPAAGTKCGVGLAQTNRVVCKRKFSAFWSETQRSVCERENPPFPQFLTTRFQVGERIALQKHVTYSCGFLAFGFFSGVGDKGFSFPKAKLTTYLPTYLPTCLPYMCSYPLQLVPGYVQVVIAANGVHPS